VVIKKWFLGTALLFTVAGGIAGAQAKDVLKGDPEAGAQKAVTCGACHGADGNSMVPSFPKLAGLGEKYLLQQMQHIRDGLRPVAQMAGQVDNMSDQDLADIAAYFSAKPRSVEKADPELIALGEKVYRAGVADRNVAACIACHSANGSGNAPAGFPAIGGQHADYIAAQLRAYRKGYEDPTGRVTDGDIKIMRSNAFGLSDMEIEAVAAYVSGLY
jgi:cytochrome c553